LGVDPLADAPENIGFSPYTYVWNNPINAIDPDGRNGDWIDQGGGIWKAEKGDSAASLAKDANIPAARANEIVVGELGPNYVGADGGVKSNVKVGNTVTVGTRPTVSYTRMTSGNQSTATVNNSPLETAATPGATSALRTISGVSGGLSSSTSSFRITNGLANGSQLSPKLYSSGWRGGSMARITTYGLGGAASAVGRGSLYGSIVLGGYNINNANIQDGRTFGYHTQVASAQTAGGVVGGYFGVKAGAAIGAGFGAGFGLIGAVPGAIVGGVIGGLGGGFGGSYLGGSAVRRSYKTP
jgi:hypothetical protein